MIAPQLVTQDVRIKLVEPDVSRDAELGVRWLNGAEGRVTMQSMGNSDTTIAEMLPATYEQEAERVRSFLERKDQLNWMIEYDGDVIGSVWVDLESSKDLPGPSVHIMIGNPDMRGKGIGSSAVGMVLDYLKGQGQSTVYSRHLTSNKGSEKLLRSLGFINLGDPYVSDTLEFQNLIREKIGQ